MSKPSAKPDRRDRRSPWPSEALALQLARVAQRHDLELIVLADRGGNLWATSRRDRSAETLAASAPHLRRVAPAGVAVASGKPLRVAALHVGRAELYLAAQGTHCARAVRDAAPGVQRILAALI